MGNIEISSRKRRRRANLQKVVLHTVAAAGILSVAMVAPQALGAMAKMGLLPNKRQKEFITASRDRLIQKRFLIYEGKFVRLTPAGERHLRLLQVDGYEKNKLKKWDGRWRVLTFDIPERKRKIRDQVRQSLAQVGFKRLQNSVWIYPYDCEDLITLLKADFKIGKDLLYMIVDSLEYDLPLRTHFKLPRS